MFQAERRDGERADRSESAGTHNAKRVGWEMRAEKYGNHGSQRVQEFGLHPEVKGLQTGRGALDIHTGQDSAAKSRLHGSTGSETI